MVDCCWDVKTFSLTNMKKRKKKHNPIRNGIFLNVNCSFFSLMHSLPVKCCECCQTASWWKSTKQSIILSQSATVSYINLQFFWYIFFNFNYFLAHWFDKIAWGMKWSDTKLKVPHTNRHWPITQLVHSLLRRENAPRLLPNGLPGG